MGAILSNPLPPGYRVRQQDILAELSACALQGGGIEELLADTARLVALGLQADICGILQCAGEDDTLLLRASLGWADPPSGKVGPAVAATACHAIEVCEAIVSASQDAEAMPPPALLRRQGVTRAIDVVIWSGGSKFGVLEAGSRLPGEFGPSDVAFMQTAANLLGAALARKHSETALADAQTRTAEILESISDSFYALDREWRFTYLNRHCESWTGRTRQELLGRSIWEMFPQAVGTPVQAAHLRAIRENRVVLTDVVSSIKPRWIEFNINPSATGLAVYFRDIDDRKRADLALRDSEQRLRLATESAGIGTWEMDLTTRRAVRSAGHATIFGVHVDEPWTDADFQRHIVRGHRKKVELARQEAFAAGGELRFSCQIRRSSDGALRWIDVRGAPERAPSGEVTRYFGVVTDITERKEAELYRDRLAETLEQRVAERTAALVESNARLTAEIAERERAEAALVQAQRHEAVGQLVAGVAHSFNNLLTICVGSLELLDLDKLRPAERRLVERATHATLQAATLTQKLVMFAGQQQLTPRPVDANQVLLGMQETLAQLLGPRVRLQSECAPQLWLAAADGEQLRTVIMNLATNAREAMPEGGTLRIATRNLPAGDPALPEDMAAVDFVMLALADDGIGMPPEVAAKACEPFFTTKRGGRGAGLGLAQVDGVVRELGGAIRLRSAPGRGTTVQVFLPRSGSVAAAAAPVPALVEP
jgi:PAS domain S-box-containing protein